MKRTCKDIRTEFIQFFEQRGHTFVPSGSLLPAADPTLLFTNAGMNQFKDIFLGRETPDYMRAVNSQKCIRAGGKHNDLEDVGHDTHHHTFFEMLGNWSFGDYFKEEAIRWAWELLTDVWSLPGDRLYATVFGGDENNDLPPDTEAEELWKKVTDINPSHVLRFGKKDNFWEMGETGPCGPCSEIHIDLTEDGSGAKLVNEGDPRVIELWNLVFIQYNCEEGGKLTALPNKHVDTGLGLERIGFVLAGKRSNYATDLFVPLIKKIETLTDHRYGSTGAGTPDDRFDVMGERDIRDVACRVIADHARALTFAISDGVIPSNEGRGYVLRRILRRACRYGRQYLDIDGVFLVKLVPMVVELMEEAFPELVERKKYVMETIEGEEESFGRTLDRGIDLFQRQMDKLRKSGKELLSGEVAFDLYATYGFPVDLTQIMAGELGMSVDMEGFQREMARHRELSGAGEAFKSEMVTNLPETDDSGKYQCEPIDSAVLGWVIDDEYVDCGELSCGTEGSIVLDRTSFYGEQGGQVGDSGVLSFPDGKFVVRDTKVVGGCVLHVGVLESGKLRVGQVVTTRVDPSRVDIMRNHTATHLLNWALREVLGDHVNQGGSVVAPDRLRFDFTHNQGLSDEQLEQVERMVNQRVLDDDPVTAKLAPLLEARKIPGVRAVFGEKYPDPVRVLYMGEVHDADQSLAPDAVSNVEFCGGTHLERTSQVGLFKILSEESVAKGIRRITAVTGSRAVEYVQEMDRVLREAALAVRVAPRQLPERIVAMQKEIRQLRKRPSGSPAQQQGFKGEVVLEVPEGKVLVGQIEGGDASQMRNLCDVQRQKGAAALLVGCADEEKVTLVAMVSEELAARGKLRASDWIKSVAVIVDGSGGGKPTMAQGGGKLPEKLPEGLQAGADYARTQLR